MTKHVSAIAVLTLAILGFYFVTSQESSTDDGLPVQERPGLHEISNPDQQAVPQDNSVQTLTADNQPNSADSIRKVFDALYVRVQNNETRAMVYLSDLLVYRCAYALEHDSVLALRSFYENSSLAHTFDYNERLNDFEGCKYALEQAPDGADPTEWGLDLLSKSADLGDLVAEFTLVQLGGGNSAKFLDEHPGVLNEDHPRPRAAALNILAQADPSIMEDEIVSNAWLASICEKDPGCSMAEGWEQLANGLAEWEVDQVKIEFRKLTEKFEQNRPFNFQEKLTGRE